MRVPRQKPEKARIEIIPMIDVIFFLLVFFMVSTLSMTINRGLPVNLPKATTSQKDLRESFNCGSYTEPSLRMASARHAMRGKPRGNDRDTPEQMANLAPCQSW